MGARRGSGGAGVSGVTYGPPDAAALADARKQHASGALLPGLASRTMALPGARLEQRSPME